MSDVKNEHVASDDAPDSSEPREPAAVELSREVTVEGDEGATQTRDTVVDAGPAPQSNPNDNERDQKAGEKAGEKRDQKRDKTLVLDEPGGRHRWGRFLLRLLKVLLRPVAFWEGLRDEQLTVGEIMWPHVIVMLGLRAGAGFFGELLADGDMVSGLVALVSSFVSWLALIWIFAIVVGSVATARGARINALDPLAFAAYGLAPIFVVGVLAVIPLPYVAPIAELIAMPYTFYVMALGVVPLLGVQVERAPAVVGIFCGVLLILWGIMPTLVPLLMGALTK